MKKILLSSLLFLSFAIANAQTINSISVTPVAPTTNDQVGIIINSTFGFNCISDSFAFNIVGNAIYINMYQCLGMLSILCTKTDTVNVGQLTAGIKTVQVLIHTAQANPSCSIYSPPFPPTIIYTFVVSQFMSTQEANSNFSFSIFPNPSSGNINFQYNISETATLEVYNLVGEKIKTYSLLAGNSHFAIKDGELKSGIYFAKVIAGNKESFVRKFTITE